MSDDGQVKVHTLDGLVHCEGASQLTVRPSSFTGLGAQGIAEANCTDGRSFKVDFIQTEETSGHGKGLDNNGNVVSLFFAKSAEAAKERMDSMLLNKLVQ